MAIIKRELLYNTVIYQLTNQCNAKCRICCGSLSPQLNTKLDKDVILESIDSIKDMPNIKNIGITGGEPFLYPDDVLSIAEQSKKANLRFGFNTNAFWCETYSHTYEVMLQLKRNDLVKCIISADAFHQEFVSVECVRILLSVCRDLRIPILIQTNSTKSTFSRTDEIIKKLEIDKLCADILFAAAYPVGAAKHLNQDDFFTRKLEHTLCLYQNQLYVSSDGKINPCCSVCCVGVPFDFGNIYNDSLKGILKRVSENELMLTIAYEGFSRLLKKANEELGFNELEEYVDTCHLCNHLLDDSERYLYLQEKLIY